MCPERGEQAKTIDMIVQCLKLLHKKLYTEKDMHGTKYVVGFRLAVSS